MEPAADKAGGEADALEATGPEETQPEQTVTAEEAAAWLLRVRPAGVLALLKEPDVALPVSRAFVGFRTDAKAYANPLVRGRLAQAAARDPKVAARLRNLAALAAPAPAPESAAPLPPTDPAPAPPQIDPTDALRAERDRRRRERDEARQAQASAEAERDAAAKARLGAEAERDAALQLARRQADRLARLERQAARARAVEVGLLKALGEDKVSPPPSASPRSAQAVPAPVPPTSPWIEAVRHLLDRSKWDAALALAEDVLKADADERDALDIAARACEGRREPRAAAAFVRRLLAVQIARGDIAGATEALERLLRIVPHPHEADPEARRLLLALSPTDTRAVEAARRMLARLQGSAPAAAEWLAGTVSARTALAPVLMPAPGALAPDDALPLRLGLTRTLTVRQALQAVDRGAEALVQAVRDALAGIAGSDTHRRIWAALEADSADEPERLAPLRRVPRGPVVVDGSNVAWFDQESLAQGCPRLRHLLAVRRALWARGFFPVVLHADANLPYFIDDKAGLLALRDRGELGLVDAGTVADEVLLRTAKLLGAPLVTNDRMEDWDPGDEVRKARYAVSANGPAYLLDDV